MLNSIILTTLVAITSVHSSAIYPASHTLISRAEDKAPWIERFAGVNNICDGSPQAFPNEKKHPSPRNQYVLVFQPQTFHEPVSHFRPTVSSDPPPTPFPTPAAKDACEGEAFLLIHGNSKTFFGSGSLQATKVGLYHSPS